MNLAALTPRQWAYVLQRLDHPDATPLDHPGNPRKQNLDRIADQLSEQLDGDELQALRAMVTGKRPQGSAYDEEAGRDVDAELTEAAASAEPLDDMEAYIARAFRPAPPAETAATRRMQAVDEAWDSPAEDGASAAPDDADGVSGSDGGPELDSRRSPDEPAPRRIQRRSGGRAQQASDDAPAVAQPPVVPAPEARRSASPASEADPSRPRAANVLQPQLF